MKVGNVGTLACAGLLLLASFSQADPKPTTEIVWKTCAGMSTILSEKEVCYVKDLSTGKTTTTFNLCVGVNVNAGTLLMGGKVATLLCANVTVPTGKTDLETRQQAEKQLRDELERLRAAGKLPPELASKKIGSFMISDQAGLPAPLAKALGK